METKEKQERMPRWKLKANFIIRELARLCYGKKSIFDIRQGYDDDDMPFWKEFCGLFCRLSLSYGEAQGVAIDEMAYRMKKAIEDLEKWRVIGLKFSTPSNEAAWLTTQILGDDVSGSFLEDREVKTILIIAVQAFIFASNGQKPPYVDFVALQPLAHYDGLPVAPELEELYYNPSPSPS